MKSASAKPARRKAREEFTYATGPSSLGFVLVAVSGFGIVSILLAEKAATLAAQLQDRFPGVALREGSKEAATALARVVHFIEHPESDFTVSLDMRGTAFQRRVWTAVMAIPRGQTATYGEIAARIGAPRAMRAVGSSCTRCHFAVVVPCLRVLPKGQTLAGQLKTASKRRRAFLAREGIVS